MATQWCTRPLPCVKSKLCKMEAVKKFSHLLQITKVSPPNCLEPQKEETPPPKKKKKKKKKIKIQFKIHITRSYFLDDKLSFWGDVDPLRVKSEN